MSQPNSIQALVAQESALIAKRDHLECAFKAKMQELGEEIDALQVRRHALVESGFRRFDAEHGMPANNDAADAVEIAALEANRRAA